MRSTGCSTYAWIIRFVFRLHWRWGCGMGSHGWWRYCLAGIHMIKRGIRNGNGTKGITGSRYCGDRSGGLFFAADCHFAGLCDCIQSTLVQKFHPEPGWVGMRLSFQLFFNHLLITETVLSAAIGALPGDPVAGHAPDIFVHAGLADAESASASPAKEEFLPAAVALLKRFAAPVSFSNGAGGLGHMSSCRLFASMVLQVRRPISPKRK